MHNAFQNKRRRFINFRDAQTNNILPEHFSQYYPTFIALLERYYEFQDQNDSTELLNHLFASRDVNETDLTLLTFIEDELLLGEAYFKGFGTTDVELRAAANFSNILFRSKGSKFAIEWFFRSFYGEDVQVLYPKENIFKLNEPESQIGANSLRYLTDDKLYQTFALLIRVGIPISKWKEVFKLFTHPAGMYLGGEVFLVNEVEVGVKTFDEILQYPTPTYTMTPLTQTVDEGTNIVLTVNGNNVRNGGTDALLYYFGDKIFPDSAEAADFVEGFGLPDSDNPKYLEINNSTGTIQIGTVIDELAEADESINVVLTDIDGRRLTDADATIRDVLSTYTVELRNPSTAPDIIEEGTTAIFDVTGTNTAFGGDVDLLWYVDLASDSNFGHPERGKTNAQDFSAGFPTEANPAIVQVRNNTGSFNLSTVVNTSLVNLLDFEPDTAPNVTIGSKVNIYNTQEVLYTIPAGQVLSIPFKTLPYTPVDAITVGYFAIPTDLTRTLPAGYKLWLWWSEDPGGTTGTDINGVYGTTNPTVQNQTYWAHDASYNVQVVEPNKVYYLNHAVIDNTGSADYTNWTSGDLSPSSFNYNSSCAFIIGLLSPAIEPDDIGLGALERATVRLKSQTTGQEKGKTAIWLEGVVPEFSVSVPGANQVVEGNSFTFEVQVIADNLGDTFTWEILDSDLSPLTDTRIATSSGTFTANTVGQIPFTVQTTFDPEINGRLDRLGFLAEAGNELRPYHSARILVTNLNTGQTATDGIGIFDDAPTYLMTPSVAPGIQGDSAAFLITASNITDFETWFYVGLAETTLTDYDSTVPQDLSRQRVYLTDQNPDGYYLGKVDTVTAPALIGAPVYGDRPRLKFAADADTGNERLELYLYDEQTGGNKLAELNYTIAPAPVNFAGQTTLNETTNDTETYTITGLADGNYNYYFVGELIGDDLTFGGNSGSNGQWIIDEDDFDSTYYSQGAPGSLTIASGEGTISIDLKADKVREGDEKFRIVITDTLGFTVGQSPVITIEDTSVPTYTLENYAQLNDTAGGPIVIVDENDNLNLLINADSRMTETLYVELIDVTAGATALYNDTQLTIDAVDGENWLQFTTSGDNGVVDGDRTFKVILWERGFPVTENEALATLELTLQDPSDLDITLTVDDDTPNENQLLTFTVSGTNIPDGNYGYRISELVQTRTTAAGTSTIIPVESIQGIAVGDAAVALNGTVSNAAGQQILMTQASTFASGQYLYYMDDLLFDYFSTKSQTKGTVAVSGNSGTFQVQLAESLAIENRAFTMNLYETANATEVLASETFTIQDVTGGVTVILDTGFDDLFFDDYGQIIETGSPEATVFAAFRPDVDGYIHRTGRGPNEGSGQGEYIHDNLDGITLARWADGPAANGQFQVRYTILYQNASPAQGLIIGGSEGTWIDITDADPSAAEFSASVTSSSSESFNVGFKVEIREKLNQLNAKERILAPQVAGGSGGGLVLNIDDFGGGDGSNPQNP